MSKSKIFKKNVRYYSTRQGIHGLTIRGIRNSGFSSDYAVVEDLSSNLDLGKRKVVHRGDLTACRQYLKDRFRGKKV